jgi:hypothetical protein
MPTPLTGIAHRDGLAASEATGAHANTPLHLALLAGALALAGNIEEGPAALDDALPPAAVSGERGWNAEVIACAASSPVDCRIPIRLRPRSRSALPWRLPASRARGATNCVPRQASPGCDEQGRRGEVRDLLAPVYGSFTEGFDTQDLKEAKALLDEVACAPLNAWLEWHPSYQWLTRHPRGSARERGSRACPRHARPGGRAERATAGALRLCPGAARRAGRPGALSRE